MKYFLQLQMGEGGDFPGAPDLFSRVLSEGEFDELYDRFFRRRGARG